MLRVNMSVAIVAMTANRTRHDEDGTIVAVSLICNTVDTDCLLRELVKSLFRSSSPVQLYGADYCLTLQDPDFTWESSTQGVILGSFFYGVRLLVL